MNYLTGKVVIVTGCTGGVGKAVSGLFAAQGAIIAGISRRRDYLFEEEIKNISSESTFFNGDMSFYGSCERIFRKIQERYQSIDILINCAGSIIPGQFEKLNYEEIDSIIKNNLYSIVYPVRAVLPYMSRQHNGRIIVIGSLGGIIPMPYEAVYSSVKFAVRGFSLSIAEELKGTGIQLSLISPGSVKTGMLDLEAGDSYSTISFVQKPMNPEKIAEEVLLIIYKPRREVILPKNSALMSLAVNRFSFLFGLLFPVLNILGKIGQNSYRTRCLE